MLINSVQSEWIWIWIEIEFELKLNWIWIEIELNLNWNWIEISNVEGSRALPTGHQRGGMEPEATGRDETGSAAGHRLTPPLPAIRRRCSAHSTHSTHSSFSPSSHWIESARPEWLTGQRPQLGNLFRWISLLCNRTALKMHRYLKTALQLHCNCSRIALELHCGQRSHKPVDADWCQLKSL